ncbi:MAG: hypothetical protein VB049_07730 [Candidatus Pelethousia sp.]|nr:hypothetical protein [Candidatus Pelethousia sp.]
MISVNKSIRLSIIALLTVALLAGCGNPVATESATAAQTPAVVQEPADAPLPEGPGLHETITLPDGWTMDQAITMADIEAVTGQTGYQFFPEGASDAKNGNPAGSFTIAGKGDRKVGFFVFTKGKQEKADYFQDFAVEGSVEGIDSPVWDHGYIADFMDGSSAIVVLRGDCCMRINYFPDGHAGKDKTELGTALAELLINKLYGGEAAAPLASAAPEATQEAAAPAENGGIPDALPSELTSAATLNEFATKLFLEHVKANIFIAPVFSEEDLANARKALPLIIEATTKAVALDAGMAELYYLRGKAYAYTYYDAKDAAMQEKGLADLQTAMDMGLSEDMVKPEYDQLASK